MVEAVVVAVDHFSVVDDFVAVADVALGLLGMVICFPGTELLVNYIFNDSYDTFLQFF